MRKLLNLKILLFVMLNLILLSSSLVFANESNEEFTEEDFKAIYQKELSEEEQILANEKKTIRKVDVLHGLNYNKFLQTDKMNLIGLKLKLTYEDYMTETIDFTDKRLVCDEFDSDKIGLQNVNYYLLRNGDKYPLGNVLVNVIEAEKTRETMNESKGGTRGETHEFWYATITQMPTNRVYLTGVSASDIDFSGLKFKFVFKNGEGESEEFSYDEEKDQMTMWTASSYFNPNQIGEQDVILQWNFKVKYGDKYTSWRGNYDLVYVPIIIKQDINQEMILDNYIVQGPNKKIYDYFEDFSCEGAIVHVFYDSGREADLELTEEIIDEIEFNNEEEGMTSAKVHLKEGSTVDFTVCVVDMSNELERNNSPLAKNTMIVLNNDNYGSDEIESIYSVKKEDLPSKFSLREWFELKAANQTRLGLCNLFAPTKSTETNVQMLFGQLPDYSERHADYMMSTLIGGKRTTGVISESNEGDAFANSDTTHHSTIIGYATESQIPYKDYTNMNTIKNATIVAKVNSYVDFNYTYPLIYFEGRDGEVVEIYDEDEKEEANIKTREMVKRHILEYGSVKIAESWPDQMWRSRYWYNNPYSGAGHAISIIGWDDNMDKELFVHRDTGEQPENDGAWIILNSWGEKWNGDGLCYISYEDKGITEYIGVLETELLDDGIGYSTYCDETFFKNEVSNRKDLKTFYYVKFNKEPGKDYIKSIVLPFETFEVPYNARVYIVNDLGNSSVVNDYEYVGDLVRSKHGLEINRLEFKEPYEINGDSYAIILETYADQQFKMFNENTISTYQSYSVLKEENKWTIATYELPLYVETLSQDEVNEVQVDHIEINTLPTKTSYMREEAIDLTGGKIKVYFTDGSNINKDMTASGVSYYGYTNESTALGTTPITIIFGGKSTKFNISIKEISSIEVSVLPETTHQDNSSSSGLYGGKLKVNYSDGSNNIIEMENVNVSKYMDNKLCDNSRDIFWGGYDFGIHTIKLEYFGKEVEFDVEVVPSVEIGRIISMPTKVQYYSGEAFDSTGFEIEITMTDGSIIHIYTLEDLIALNPDWWTPYTNNGRTYDGTLQVGDTRISIDEIPLENDEYQIIFEFTVVEAPGIKGDLDRSEEITIIDVRLLLQQFINSTESTTYTNEELFFMDMNNDGIVNVLDIRLLLQIYINQT